jgi:hypothetical protein
VQALSDVWRREMRGTGVSVVVVEPGIANTNLWDATFSDKVVAQKTAAMTPWQRQFYGDDYLVRCKATGVQTVGLVAASPGQVINAMLGTVILRNPPSRVSVGLDARLFWIPASYLPAWIVDAALALLHPLPQSAIAGVPVSPPALEAKDEPAPKSPARSKSPSRRKKET